MRYFRQFESGLTEAQFQAIQTEAMTCDESVWHIHEERQKSTSSQRHTETIFLRAFVLTPGCSILWVDIQPSAETAQARMFPHAMAFLHQSAERLKGHLSRVLYVRLRPQSMVTPHIDNGVYFRTRDRYHLVVKSHAGSMLTAGDEQVVMQEGELWWFDNKVLHDSRNPSDEWRIHLIFDLLHAPSQRQALAFGA